MIHPLSILKRVFGNNRVAEVQQKVTAGNNIIGKNSQITGSVDQSRSPGSRLIVGDDCLICGNISIESSNAEVVIGNNVFIGPNTSIVCSNSIHIESDILISSDCLIQDSDNHSIDFEIRKKDLADWKKNFHDWSLHPCIPIKICHGAWIGTRVIILKGVTIGEKAVVGAGSVVTKNVDPKTIVAGNPAKFIKSIN
jgi:acetyltransferase-like isoleucine patch superfamily enzyme